MKTIRTNSKAFIEKAEQYILDCIDYDGTPYAKLIHVRGHFESEYNYPANKQNYPNTQDRLAQWFMGVPSAISIDYENYRIIELAKEWGSLPIDATEKQEQRVLDNWYNLMAFRLIKLSEKHGIKY